MKNKKLKVTIFLGILTILASSQTAFALNQYSVNPGAQFRWDATKYIFIKDGLGLGNDLEYSLSYYLEFSFTNWAGLTGAEYLNGTVNNNGTIYDGELSHEIYYGGTPGQNWATIILNIGVATYPIHVYLICSTEIEQTTKPQMQTLDTNSWIDFDEPSTNNLTLTGTFISGPDVTTYTGNVEFNSDNVLKYVFDEVVQESSGETVSITRYIWNLIYTPGDSGSPNGDPGDPDSIPGFPLYTVIAAAAIGFILILRKKRLIRIKLK